MCAEYHALIRRQTEHGPKEIAVKKDRQAEGEGKGVDGPALSVLSQSAL